MRNVPLCVGLLAFALLFSGCRGMESDRPPITPQQNMYNQERFNPQQANSFFEDGMAMRRPVAGTVARGFLREDATFYQGRTEDGGGLVDEIPLTVTRELLMRGQDRYNIYCSMCHGRVGDGQGVISTGGYGYTPATDLHVGYLLEIEDGHFFDVITNGIRTMPSYAQQIAVADRWAITAYIRALQRSQRAGEEDIPASIRAEIGQMAPGADVVEEDEAAAPIDADGPAPEADTEPEMEPDAESDL